MPLLLESLLLQRRWTKGRARACGVGRSASAARLLPVLSFSAWLHSRAVHEALCGCGGRWRSPQRAALQRRRRCMPVFTCPSLHVCLCPCFPLSTGAHLPQRARRGRRDGLPHLQLGQPAAGHHLGRKLLRLRQGAAAACGRAWALSSDGCSSSDCSSSDCSSSHCSICCPWAGVGTCPWRVTEHCRAGRAQVRARGPATKRARHGPACFFSHCPSVRLCPLQGHVAFTPKRGDALLFWSINPDGAPLVTAGPPAAPALAP